MGRYLQRQMYITGGVSVADHYEHDYVKPLSGNIVETCATYQNMLGLVYRTKALYNYMPLLAAVVNEMKKLHISNYLLIYRIFFDLMVYT